MKNECCGFRIYRSVFCVLLLAVLALSGCTNAEKAKTEHVRRGDVYLKDQKYQEASLEYRGALQIDGNMAAAHWGLAQAYEGLQRVPEMIDELRRTVDLDKNNLDARIKLGNYYLVASKGQPQLMDEAERLAKEILERDPKNIEGHILMGSILFSRNDRDKAFAELNHAIELNPNRVESYLSLAKFYVVTNDRNKAEELIKKAIAIDGNSPLAHSQYGEFLAQGNRLQEAEAELVKAVEVGPKDHNARFALARFYVVNKQFDKAESNFQQLAALDGDRPESRALLAEFYAFINRTDDAVRIYQDILAKAPDYMDGRYRLAAILLGRGDVQGATQQLDAALKKDQHDRQALLLRARIRMKDNQPDGLKAAVEDLNEVLRQDPTSRLGLLYMAQANLTLGDNDKARSFAGELERNYPDFIPAKAMSLQILMSSGNAKQVISFATDLLNRISKAAPDRDLSAAQLAELAEKTYLARGAAQIQEKNFAAARQDFEMARQMAPGDPNIYNNLAFAALAENKPQDAIASFENALSVDATNFIALSGMITQYAKDKEFDKAHRSVDQALAQYPNVSWLHYLKGQVYGYQNNPQAAEAEYRRTLEIDPNYLRAYSSLAAIYISASQQDRAIAEYKKILAIRPNNPFVYTLIGILEDARQNYDAASENYRKALELDQNAAIAANNLSWLWAVTGKGNPDEAVRLAQGAVQRNPDVAGYADTLGWVYYKKNLYGAAVEQLQKAVNLDEAAARAVNGVPSATYRYHLGMALKGKGDKDGSRRELEAALRLAEKKPFADAEEAKKALATL
ncbi:MAG TPA: tetratricopeptide repeat protein [Pyrinomonadaceae bacterium]|nr:tetratricopeptide repeat protein [Pyrinomonadaceae bacterium]